MEPSVCRPKRRELSLQDLPSEILVNIFLKLPVKCLISMKCASKHWWAVISDPRFIELQFEKAVKNPGHLYIFFKESPPYIYLAERVSDCTEAMKIPRAALYQKTTAMNWSTSGGLVAILMPTDNCCYICNPILGEEIKVTMGPYFGKKMFWTAWWGFGYSFSTKEYKLILFASPISKGLTQEEKDVVLGAIYTLGSESWREIPEVPFTPAGCGHVDCDGTFFWLIFCDSDEEVVPRSHSIASFDIGSEEFRLWRGPNTDMDEESCRTLYLIRVGDTVGCVMMMNDGSLRIWILRDKVNEFWNKEYTFTQSRAHFLGLWMNRDLFCYEAPHFFTYDSNNKQFRAKLQLPFHEEYPDWGPHRGVIRTHVLCLISPWRIKELGNKAIGAFAMNSIGNNKCKFFFEWVDPATNERGKDFGNWIVRKKMELEKNIEELHKQMKEMDIAFQAKMNNWQKRRDWFQMRMNCMIKKMNDMEAKFTKKMKEWKSKEDWQGLEMEEVVEKKVALKLKMEEVVVKNEALKLKMEQVAARNDVLVKRNKEIQEEVKLAKLKMVALTAMVVVLVGIGIVFLGGQGMWKNKMLALP
ncbi:hypothetical protein Vadar_023674 [Vaccinium darrowii]|uniref:Uncharacterized protein n=1 Tax=Vaccinium darrowii TaxID=229202 RepID=A0ACB7YXV4_9ERIC|nr:hypothetical protein Vadar_023674 [Vaccinium darrowii]